MDHRPSGLGDARRGDRRDSRPLDSQAGIRMTDWKALAEHLAEALRHCQVPTDWPMAWPDGTSEGTPWVDEALATYEAALNDGRPPPHPAQSATGDGAG